MTYVAFKLSNQDDKFMTHSAIKYSANQADFHNWTLHKHISNKVHNNVSYDFTECI